MLVVVWHHRRANIEANRAVKTPQSLSHQHGHAQWFCNVGCDMKRAAVATVEEDWDYRWRVLTNQFRGKGCPGTFFNRTKPQSVSCRDGARGK